MQLLLYETLGPAGTREGADSAHPKTGSCVVLDRTATAIFKNVDQITHRIENKVYDR